MTIDRMFSLTTSLPRGKESKTASYGKEQERSFLHCLN